MHIWLNISKPVNIIQNSNRKKKIMIITRREKLFDNIQNIHDKNKNSRQTRKGSLI